MSEANGERKGGARGGKPKKEESKLRIFSKKTEIIDFRTFMKGKTKGASVTPTQLHAFIPIHPAMFIDSTFIMIVGSVVLVALLERTLANHGHVAFAEAIHTFLKIAFPIVGLAAMYFLITQLHF